MKRRGWLVLVPMFPSYRLAPDAVVFVTRAQAMESAQYMWGDEFVLVRATVEFEMPRRADLREGART